MAPEREILMREFMIIVEGALPDTVYHGTILRKWESPAGGTDGGILFLTKSRDEAESYADQAYEQGCITELNDDGEFPYDAGAAPVIISFDFTQLLKTPGLEFDHDWGWADAPEGATWQQSLEAVGSFVMTGFTEAHKSLAKVELAYPEYHAEKTALLESFGLDDIKPKIFTNPSAGTLQGIITNVMRNRKKLEIAMKEHGATLGLYDARDADDMVVRGSITPDGRILIGDAFLVIHNDFYDHDGNRPPLIDFYINDKNIIVVSDSGGRSREGRDALDRAADKWGMFVSGRLYEAWIGDHQQGPYESSSIYIDPDRQELRRVLAGSRYQELRAILTPNHLYIWDGGAFAHHDFPEEHLRDEDKGIETLKGYRTSPQQGVNLYIRPSGPCDITANWDLDDFEEEERFEEIAAYTEAHPIMKRLFGNFKFQVKPD